MIAGFYMLKEKRNRLGTWKHSHRRALRRKDETMLGNSNIIWIFLLQKLGFVLIETFVFVYVSVCNMCLSC